MGATRIEGSAADRSHESMASQAAARVDVGLTAYLRATYIREAIESVLAQTFPYWHLTICDNGVGGGEIAEAVSDYLDDPRISYHVTGRELSLAENWTRALGLGKATYVSILNDDDRWHPDYLEARVRVLDSHEECGFAFSEWAQIDETGRVTMIAPIARPEGVISCREAATWFIEKNPVAPPSILLRRSACQAVGPFFDGAWQFCDWDLWARIAARFPIYYLARQDNDFRRHAQAYTFAERESPDQLLAMVSHLEQLFTRNVEGFRLSRLDRARLRSETLLRTAADAHMGHGWSASGATYLRALREFPPSFFTRLSLTLATKSLLGRRASRIVSRWLSWTRSFVGRSGASAPRIVSERPALVRRVRRRLAATLRWEQRLDAFESYRLDRRLGTDTGGTAAINELTIAAGKPLHGLSYVATSPRLARWWLHALPDPRGSTIVDMGSGKGRVLVLAALRGYARAIGVEFALELHKVSVRNAAALAQLGHTIEPRLGDAGDFEFPDDTLVVHFNNPFHAPVMERVIANLASSYERSPRPIVVVYQQMTFEPPEDQTGNLELLDQVPFLRGRTLTSPKSWLDRRMVAPFTVRIYESDEARSRPVP